MYLEVSPRRTGKTTRLVRAIKQYIKEDAQTALVFTHSHSWANELGKLIGERKRGQVEFMYNKKNFDDYLIGCDRTVTQRIFVDEFDFLDWYPIEINGYYVTTPKRQRSVADMMSFMLGETEDKMLQLIAFNNGHYEQYSPMEWLSRMDVGKIRDLRLAQNRSTYEMEFFSNIFK
jgi:hypothetical protein